MAAAVARGGGSPKTVDRVLGVLVAACASALLVALGARAGARAGASFTTLLRLAYQGSSSSSSKRRSSRREGEEEGDAYFEYAHGSRSTTAAGAGAGRGGLVLHSGSCHCGGLAFEVEAPEHLAAIEGPSKVGVLLWWMHRAFAMCLGAVCDVLFVFFLQGWWKGRPFIVVVVDSCTARREASSSWCCFITRTVQDADRLLLQKYIARVIPIMGAQWEQSVSRSSCVRYISVHVSCRLTTALGPSGVLSRCTRKQQ